MCFCGIKRVRHMHNPVPNICPRILCFCADISQAGWDSLLRGEGKKEMGPRVTPGIRRKQAVHSESGACHSTKPATEGGGGR